MMTMLKNFLSGKIENFQPKKNVRDVTSELEKSFDSDDFESNYLKNNKLVYLALDAREALNAEAYTLKKKDKIRLIKALSRAKVRAVMSQTSHGHNTFRKLDSISADLIVYL